MPDELTTLGALVFAGALVAFGCLFAFTSLLLSDDARRRQRRYLRAAAGSNAVAQSRVNRHIPTGSQPLRRVDPVPGRLQGMERLLYRIPLVGGPENLRRLQRAGLKPSLSSYVLSMATLGMGVALALNMATSLPGAVVVLAGLGIGTMLPRFVVDWLGARRAEKFLVVLPEAIDVIVRGIKAGLPVIESITAVGEEFPDPVGAEFRGVGERVKLGASIEDALWDIAERVGKPEFNFLAISVAIQRETGGNLGEALENLSSILRQRQQMKLKVRALSSEARASAYILGAMPFVMTLLIYVVNSSYISALFVDPRGHMLLAAGVGSITLGALVMARMVRFEI